MVPRQQQQSWFRNMEDKLRRNYAAITCTRASDVVHHRAAQRPSRPQVPPPNRHEPRPRLTPQPTPRPPPPDQAGGSAWQETSSLDWWQQLEQQSSLDFGFRPPPQPHGMYLSILIHINCRLGNSSILMFSHAGAYGHHASMSEHQSSMSDSTWASDHDGGNNIMPDHGTHTDWMNFLQSTPPPYPTHETQYDEHGSEIPARNVGPPRRYGWTTPRLPPARRGRRRG